MKSFLPLLLCMLVGAPLLAELQGLDYSPRQWNFGPVNRGDTVSLDLTVRNRDPQTVKAEVIPTCGCQKVVPSELSLAPGALGVFRLFYDSSDDTGAVRKYFILRETPTGETPVSGSSKLETFPTWGTVNEPAAARETWGSAGSSAPIGPGSGREVRLAYYYTPGCKSCERFLSEELPRLERDLGIRIVVDKKDVLDPIVYAELEKAASALGTRIDALPALHIGDRLLQGEGEIHERLSGLLSAAVTPPADLGAKGTALRGLAALPVILGGLLDGVNPCAFTTLIFLLASLALAGKGRREVLVIGALFSLAVFLTYLAIGLGFFAALRAASAYTVVSRILHWVLFAVLVAFAGLSLYDWLLILRGRPKEILLQLPTVLKRRIHASIRTRVRTVALAGSSLVLGFLVSVFEFACTGQVYLPTLAYLVRMQREPQALLLLLLYNLGFILPLLVVFGASYLGVGSKRIAALFQRHMAAVKAGLALFFLAMAAFTLAG